MPRRVVEPRRCLLRKRSLWLAADDAILQRRRGVQSQPPWDHLALPEWPPQSDVRVQPAPEAPLGAGPLGAERVLSGQSTAPPPAPAPPSRPSVPVGQVRRTRGCGAGWEVSARSAGEALAAAAASVCPYGASGGAAGPGVA